MATTLDVLTSLGMRLGALALAILVAAVLAHVWRALAGDAVPGEIEFAVLGPVVLMAFFALRRVPMPAVLRPTRVRVDAGIA